jgi:NAD(P)-dependent dehydrogenase (short-subunit alcohol dehydrogenase family)
MRILIIGASGTIGRAIVAALEPSHELVLASRQTTPIAVDIQDPKSIAAMYRAVRKIDAVICSAGDVAFVPLSQLSDADFDYSLKNMLMGQVNLVRYGLSIVADRGSFTLTAGTLSRLPMHGGAAISLVTAGLEGFVRAAAMEAPRGIRVNIVSPPWVTETLQARGIDLSNSLPAAVGARSYLENLFGQDSGVVIEPKAALSSL